MKSFNNQKLTKSTQNLNNIDSIEFFKQGIWAKADDLTKTEISYFFFISKNNKNLYFFCNEEKCTYTEFSLIGLSSDFDAKTSGVLPHTSQFWVCSLNKCGIYTFPSMNFQRVLNSNSEILGLGFSNKNFVIINKENIFVPGLTTYNGYRSTFLSDPKAAGQVTAEPDKFWVWDQNKISIFEFSFTAVFDNFSNKEIFYKRTKIFDKKYDNNNFEVFEEKLLEKNSETISFSSGYLNTDWLYKNFTFLVYPYCSADSYYKSLNRGKTVNGCNFEETDGFGSKIHSILPNVELKLPKDSNHFTITKDKNSNFSLLTIKLQKEKNLVFYSLNLTANLNFQVFCSWNNPTISLSNTKKAFRFKQINEEIGEQFLDYSLTMVARNLSVVIYDPDYKKNLRDHPIYGNYNSTFESSHKKFLNISFSPEIAPQIYYSIYINRTQNFWGMLAGPGILFFILFCIGLLNSISFSKTENRGNPFKIFYSEKARQNHIYANLIFEEINTRGNLVENSEKSIQNKQNLFENNKNKGRAATNKPDGKLKTYKPGSKLKFLKRPNVNLPRKPIITAVHYGITMEELQNLKNKNFRKADSSSGTDSFENLGNLGQNRLERNQLEAGINRDGDLYNNARIAVGERVGSKQDIPIEEIELIGRVEKGTEYKPPTPYKPNF